MPNTITTNRILSQMVPSTSVSPEEAYQAIQAVSQFSPPIALDELRDILLNEFGLKNQEEICELDSLHFESIYDFVSWYSANQSKFVQNQKVALDTFVQVRAAIESGCICKRAKREVVAHQYFADFWANNCKTDLLATVAKVAGAKKVSVGNLCSYPS